MHRLEGALDSAEPLYEQVVTIARAQRDRDSIAIGLLNLSMTAIGRGFGEPRKTMLLEVLAIADDIGSKPAGQSVLEVSAGLAAAREEWDRAMRFFGAAEAQTGQTGLHRDPADEAFLAPWIVMARKALGNGAAIKAEADGRVLSYDEAIVEVTELARHVSLTPNFRTPHASECS